MTAFGIPCSEQGRVFDKFYRSSNLPDRSLPGIGLGLSYVKLLVEAHRGTVFLTSQDWEGDDGGNNHSTIICTDGYREYK